ncbi:DUF6442 family protein [Ruminococcus flavefaciens]|jgi:hypothetical protein|uniref:Uncharacterized protein n=1 Tax=Ruminococcus flavefaciens TaxID=1265 RepID=A0A315XX17_RUMFL|nr:DUF6442 family protein [Ruminococcus flavefaciens]MBQ6168844.1 hypothetical protein [Ruminococcus sp.]MBR3667042.1 hypothetical protein [Ruminococcus sp.]PWJ10102.1 hypothetical protein IE37_03194 [Ruminococcus flavefaciens]SSA52056.1 hypothetical protein SAMN02910325_03194 [Ruminococcus flavefaciens]
MNKEEILAKSRQENKGNDPVAVDIKAKGLQLGAKIGITMAFILYFADMAFFDERNYGYYSLFAAFLTAFWGYKASRTKETRIGIAAGLMGFVTAVSLILHFTGHGA